MLLWVTSFVDSGYLETEEEAKTIYQNLLLTSVLGVCIFMPCVVRYADSWPPGPMISVSFLLRAILLCFGFPFLKKPDTFWTFFISFWMMTFTGFQAVSVEAYQLKIIPSDVSGTIRGIFNFFG